MNQVVLVGRLTRDPDVRYTASQLAVARITVAVDRPYRSNNQQSDQPTADFINVTAFGKTAEIIERFFTKGRLIGVQGRIQNDNYTNKDGVTVYSYNVVADRIEFIGSKAESGGAQRDSDGGYSISSRASAGGTGGNSQDADIPPEFSILDDEDMPF